jgi:acid stress chaperone HdeB
MNRKLIAAAAVLAAFAAQPASAQVVIQMAEITCQQFADADPGRQALIASWVSGYTSASKNLIMFDLNYAKRNAEVVLDYCKKHKSESFLAAVEKTAH